MQLLIFAILSIVMKVLWNRPMKFKIRVTTCQGRTMHSNPPRECKNGTKRKNDSKTKENINEDKGEDDGSPTQKAKKKTTNVEEE